jgi:N-acetylmuramoyl-L-alanine amidase
MLRAALSLLTLLLVLAIPAFISSIELWPANNVHYIVIHHAASGAADFALENGSSEIFNSRSGRARIITPRGASLDISEKEIDKLHRARGFDSTGYNYIVRFDGTVEKGRPEDLRGAHAKQWDERGVSYNASSIGICFAGNCNAARWTVEQQQSGYRLILELMRRYDVPPERVIGHRECGNETDCPGTLINMDAVRAKLGNLNNPQPLAEP